mgnify:CR=1 FL=1
MLNLIFFLVYPAKYINLQSSDSGCWAQIGYVGHWATYKTNQPINLNENDGCVYPMVIEHEFLHAMGMFHEQSRPDRDNYIDVHWSNIQDRDTKTASIEIQKKS